MNWHKITKDTINDYFNNPNISLYQEFNSFINVDSFLEKMRQINDSMEINKWHIESLSIDFRVDSVKSIKYTIFQYNIIKFL